MVAHVTRVGKSAADSSTYSFNKLWGETRQGEQGGKFSFPAVGDRPRASAEKVRLVMPRL